MWLTETHNDNFYDGLDLTELAIDQFYIKFVNKTKDLWLLTKYQECHKCQYTLKSPEPLMASKYVPMTCLPKEDWRIVSRRVERMFPNSTENVICDASPDFGEFGVYEFNLLNCQVNELKTPVNIYAGILTVCLLVSSFIALGYGLIYALQLIKQSKNKGKVQPQTESTNVNQKKRVQSLDTFRGISIVIMIFVNYGAGRYEFLEHAYWNGLNLADCVFPWFMWIMGVCIPISIKSTTKGNANHFYIFLNILRRSVILFMLGLFLNQGVVLDKIRIFGVLQRFALCYFSVATLELLFSKLKTTEAKVIFFITTDFAKIFHDVFILVPEWLIVAVVMSIHLILTFELEVPGCPKGYLGPGGLHEFGKFENCTGGATGYIDRMVLGENHIYKHPTFGLIYKTGAFDPEGLFGTLNSIVQVFLGVQCGTTLLIFKNHKDRLLRWTFWGTLLGLLGGTLCYFSKDDGPIPINKNLWSLSFVFATSSLAFYLLSFCYLIIDVYGKWSGKPFLFAGMNATIMYVGHSLTYSFPFQFNLTPMNTHYLFLANAIWGTSIWIIISYRLFANKFFLSI